MGRGTHLNETFIGGTYWNDVYECDKFPYFFDQRDPRHQGTLSCMESEKAFHCLTHIETGDLPHDLTSGVAGLYMLSWDDEGDFMLSTFPFWLRVTLPEAIRS